MDHLRRRMPPGRSVALGVIAVLLASLPMRAQQERSTGEAVSPAGNAQNVTTPVPPSAAGRIPAAAPAGNAENGKKLYNAIGCWSCHGYSAQGARTGARLAPNPIPFPAFVRYVREPGGEMPPYTAKVVSDAQLADIYAFLRSIPPPREAKDIPALNQ